MEKNVIDVAIAWVKNEVIIEKMNYLVESLWNYGLRRHAKLNNFSGSIIICFGDKRKEILLFNQHEIHVGDEIRCNNKSYKVINIYTKTYNGNRIQIVDWD